MKKLESLKEKKQELLMNLSQIVGGATDCVGTPSEIHQVTYRWPVPGSDQRDTGDWDDEGTC